MCDYKHYEIETKMPDVFLFIILALLFSIPIGIGITCLISGKPVPQIENPWLFAWLPTVVVSYILGWFRVYLRVGKS